MTSSPLIICLLAVIQLGVCQPTQPPTTQSPTTSSPITSTPTFAPTTKAPTVVVVTPTTQSFDTNVQRNAGVYGDSDSFWAYIVLMYMSVIFGPVWFVFWKVYKYVMPDSLSAHVRMSLWLVLLFFIGWPVWLATIVVSALGPESKTAYVINLVLFCLVLLINIGATLLMIWPPAKSLIRLGNAGTFGCVKCGVVEQFAREKGINLVITKTRNPRNGMVTMTLSAPLIKWGAGKTVPAKDYAGVDPSEEVAKDQAYDQLVNSWMVIPDFQRLYTNAVAESPSSMSVGDHTVMAAGLMAEKPVDVELGSGMTSRPPSYKRSVSKRDPSPSGKVDVPLVLACAVEQQLVRPTAKYREKYNPNRVANSQGMGGQFQLVEGESDVQRALDMGRVTLVGPYPEIVGRPQGWFSCDRIVDALPWLLNGYRVDSVRV